MKRIFSIVAALLFFSSPSIKAQSDAGAIFLLISPGARAGGMGEAQVAVANLSLIHISEPTRPY